MFLGDATLLRMMIMLMFMMMRLYDVVGGDDDGDYNGDMTMMMMTVHCPAFFLKLQLCNQSILFHSFPR